MKTIIIQLLCISALFSASLARADRDLSMIRNAEFTDFLLKEEQTVSDPRHLTRIYWHGEKTKKSMLVMHGLHESPRYMESLSRHFYDRGYNVISLLLPGHMRKDGDAIDHVKFRQWVAAAALAFKATQDLGEQTEILGYSLGAALGVRLGLEQPSLVKKLYLIAPALALSNQIFWTSTLLGWTNIDSTKLYRPVEKFAGWMDDEFEILSLEGIRSSPSAGMQIQLMIDEELSTYVPHSGVGPEPSRNYYHDLLEMYLKLEMPLFIADTEADTVVNTAFNEKFMEEFQGEKTLVIYPKNLHVSHIAINKGDADAFEKVSGVENPYFKQMTNQMDEK